MINSITNFHSNSTRRAKKMGKIGETTFSDLVDVLLKASFMWCRKMRKWCMLRSMIIIFVASRHLKKINDNILNSHFCWNSIFSSTEKKIVWHQRGQECGKFLACWDFFSNFSIDERRKKFNNLKSWHGRNLLLLTLRTNSSKSSNEEKKID